MIEFMKKRKKIISVLVSLVVFLVAMRFLLLLLRPKTCDGIKQAAYLYAQPRNTVDVAFMGSSHIHCGINTKLLWDEYGIAAYDYSAAEQPLWITYYYMKEMCRYQQPKLIVLDLFAPARFKDDYQYRWLSDNLNGVRFSLNKLHMAQVGCEKEKFFEYFPSFYNYHGRYDELGMDDVREFFMTNRKRAAYKGYTPYYEISPQPDPVFETDKREKLTPKSEEYLEKIIDFAEENDIELCFLVMPYSITVEEEMVFNSLEDIAGQNGIPFYNANQNYKEIGLDYSTDFNDYSHLNYDGGIKFTGYLGDKLKSMYDIEDRRGEKRWESWDRQE